LIHCYSTTLQTTNAFSLLNLPVGVHTVYTMGRGQFKVNEETIRDINKVDNTIVEILQNKNKADDQEFKIKVTNLVQTIISKGQRLDDKELVESDVIVPDSDISLEEAKE
jgi:hypothetical protein